MLEFSGLPVGNERAEERIHELAKAYGAVKAVVVGKVNSTVRTCRLIDENRKTVHVYDYILVDKKKGKKK